MQKSLNIFPRHTHFWVWLGAMINSQRLLNLKNKFYIGTKRQIYMAVMKNITERIPKREYIETSSRH